MQPALSALGTSAQAARWLQSGGSTAAADQQVAGDDRLFISDFRVPNSGSIIWISGGLTPPFSRAGRTATPPVFRSATRPASAATAC